MSVMRTRNGDRIYCDGCQTNFATSCFSINKGQGVFHTCDTCYDNNPYFKKIDLGDQVSLSWWGPPENVIELVVGKNFDSTLLLNKKQVINLRDTLNNLYPRPTVPIEPSPFTEEDRKLLGEDCD